MSLRRFTRRISKISERRPSNSAPGEEVSTGSPTTATCATTTPPPTWPIVLQIFPDEGLHALVYHHTINTRACGLIHCWTYVSQGMPKAGQKEIVFTVRRRIKSEREIDFPPDPLRWYETVFTAAKQGKVTGEFQRGDVRVPVFLGRTDIKWIMYVSPRPITNVPPAFLPQDWLQAIPFLSPEAEVAERFGVMRALGHLGSSQRCFPWPPWIDRDRTPCITRSQMEGSIRGEVSYAVIPGISAVKKQSNFVLYIPAEAESGIKEVIEVFESNKALPLDCVHYQGADSGLLWCNTDVEPRGYAAQDLRSCMNLNFFTFCPEGLENELKIVEDGCVFMLQTETYEYIRNQLKDLQPASVSLPSGEVFQVQYDRDRSLSPELLGSKKMQQLPETPTPASIKPWHVHCDHVNLLDNNVTDPADSEPIAAYIKRIENVLDEVIPKASPPAAQGGGRVAVEADVGGPDRWDKPGRRWITIHFTPPALEALPLSVLQERLVELETPDIEPRTRFQLMFNVWGYRRQ